MELDGSLVQNKGSHQKKEPEARRCHHVNLKVLFLFSLCVLLFYGISNCTQGVKNFIFTHIPSATASKKGGAASNMDNYMDLNFNLPWLGGLSADHYSGSDWIQFLINFTAVNLDPTEPIFIVCADDNFKEALLNWLIISLSSASQNQPPKNILAVTNTPEICSLLEEHKVKVSCLLMSVHDISISINKKISIFRRLLVIRLSVMRVLNHMGYDVVNMDSDAIMLRNLVPVLKQHGNSDVVGTFGGKRPLQLFQKWGVVVCMGAILIRSSSRTEFLWESMRRIDEFNDQILFNKALDAANITWKRSSTEQTPTDLNMTTHWEGHCSNGLKVTLLPQVVACRSIWCVREIKDRVYVWHHGQNKHKFSNMNSKAQEDRVWLLRSDWSSIDGKGVHLKGQLWLSGITNHTL